MKTAWLSALAICALAASLLAGFNPFQSGPEIAYNDARQTKVESVDIGIPNSGFMVMEDEEVGMTMIWIDDTIEEGAGAGS